MPTKYPSNVETIASSEMAGEYMLVGTMLRLVLEDATSANPLRRYDVERFLGNHGIEFWARILGLGDEFVKNMHTAIAERQQQGPTRGLRGRAGSRW
jgi:hypothetical protein